jgi:hypothetical protein
MKSDQYSNVILTVIAFCLVILCVRPYFNERTVLAQGSPAGPQEVQIVGISDSVEVPVKLMGVAESALVPVRVDGTGKNAIIPVGISGVRGTIPISIQDVNATLTLPVGIRGVKYNSSDNRWEWGPIPVKPTQ